MAPVVGSTSAVEVEGGKEVTDPHSEPVTINPIAEEWSVHYIAEQEDYECHFDISYNARLRMFRQNILAAWVSYSKFWSYRQQVYAYNQIYDISRGVMCPD